jgi:predicted porin
MYKRYVKFSLIFATLPGTLAFSQETSSITLYGRINTTVESQETGDQSRVNVLQNNASRWGVRGKEDLGSGLSAFFLLESTGDSSAGFNRNAYVGMKGGFGEVRMGNITNIAYLSSADYVSMHNHDTGTSSDALYAFNVAFGARFNTVAYSTPTYKGLRAEISYAFKEDRPANAVNAVLEYRLSDTELSASYSHSGNNRLVALRALQTMGPFKLGGYIEQDSFNGDRRNNLRLVGMYTVGASEWHINVGRAGNRGGLAQTGATQATLAYNYNLSRRTKLYAFYTRLSNQAAAAYSAFARVQPGQDQNSLAIGLRHAF